MKPTSSVGKDLTNVWDSVLNAEMSIYVDKYLTENIRNTRCLMRMECVPKYIKDRTI